MRRVEPLITGAYLKADTQKAALAPGEELATIEEQLSGTPIPIKYFHNGYLLITIFSFD